eukprot:3243141-Amphidinium_carterae.1
MSASSDGLVEREHGNRKATPKTCQVWVIFLCSQVHPKGNPPALKMFAAKLAYRPKETSI